MSLRAGLFNGHAAMTWGLREGAAGLAADPLLRVAGDFKLGMALDFVLTGEIEQAGARTQLTLRIALSGKRAAANDTDAIRQLTELRRYADDDLKKKLEPVEGVAAVKVGGGLEDEIQVEIDKQRIAQLNLPIDTVIQRLKQENINISGGRLEEGSQRYLVRTVNEFATVPEISEMLVTTQKSGSNAAAACWSPRWAASRSHVASVTYSAPAAGWRPKSSIGSRRRGTGTGHRASGRRR